MTRRAPSASLEAVFGRIVRRHRQAKQLSQEELGFRADLHRTYISMVERGERCPSLETLLKLARGLDVPAATLVTETERGWKQ
jgi:transcriptional regulator with XRE-family HTH domain